MKEGIDVKVLANLFYEVLNDIEECKDCPYHDLCDDYELYYNMTVCDVMNDLL